MYTEAHLRVLSGVLCLASKVLVVAEEKISKGVWKYTLPCKCACAVFPACNLHCGYNMMVLTTWLCALEMMQNGLKTSDIG